MSSAVSLMVAVTSDNAWGIPLVKRVWIVSSDRAGRSEGLKGARPRLELQILNRILYCCAKASPEVPAWPGCGCRESKLGTIWNADQIFRLQHPILIGSETTCS